MATAPLHFAEAPIASAESEAGIIAAILFDNGLIDRVADIVTANDFSVPFYRAVFEAAVQDRNLGKAVNAVSLRRVFGDEKARELVGLTSSANVASIGAVDFAKDVRELGRKRRIVEGMEALSSDARMVGTGEAELTADDLQAHMEALIATDSGEAPQEVSAYDATAQVIRNLNDRSTGVFSGIGAMDGVIGDIRPSDLVILGARPGMGKTATSVSYALGAAQRGHGVLFLSLEMSVEALAERIIADICFDGPVDVPYSAITTKRFTSEQGREMARAADKVHDLPLTIVHRGGMKVGAMNTIVRRTKRRMAAKGHKLELVIVDYLQIANPDDRESSAYSRVSEVSKALKAMAINQEVGVMALAQLSRDVEKRGGNHRPNLSDLRDSGQIEQDADAVCFLFANEYYLKQCEPSPSDPMRLDWEREMHDAASKLEFIGAKQRRGPGGTGHGHFYRNYQAVRG